MSVLPIRVFPDPILRKRASEVVSINDGIKKLAKDMLETMLQAEGVGLAAPQVGVLKRVVTIKVPEKPALTLINPQKVSKRGKRVIEEGCLSVPGYTGLVERAVRVSAKYLNENGDRLQITAEEILAQAIEHEIDHLNGILFLDHLKAHENLVKDGVSPDSPHWHDVGYKVYVDKESPIKEKDHTMLEMLEARAKFSKLNNTSSLSEASYDLH